MADQTERSFQKQQTIFLNRKKGLGVKKKNSLRYIRNVGLGFKTPREAIEGTYIDKKCPFTGNISIRGRILTGVVRKMKMQRTIVIRRDYLHYVKKYNRFEKRHKNLSVHLSPCFSLRHSLPARACTTSQQVNHPERFRWAVCSGNLRQWKG
ncbi:small ribosomal subunit protein uS17 isoform X2 [Halyomorpha halys]|uniref:small ribosomal subunit protein uS17 isoform X2 n=1 Tax=Halyomorpha halys TaxID=286706 RepID=UPI0006D51912|nr:40S ribosomal protein S11-like isoform X2 [Halyomorpha halys]